MKWELSSPASGDDEEGCNAGTKIIAGIILLSVSATLFLSPSLRDCYLPRTRSWARDVVLDWIESVADFQPVESGWRRRTQLFHQQRRRFGSNSDVSSNNGHFHFDP
eukprot:XP_024442347.1 uncharacterized protein LOC112324345 [Populus trichocarpa]